MRRRLCAVVILLLVLVACRPSPAEETPTLGEVDARLLALAAHIDSRLPDHTLVPDSEEPRTLDCSDAGAEPNFVGTVSVSRSFELRPEPERDEYVALLSVIRVAFEEQGYTFYRARLEGRAPRISMVGSDGYAAANGKVTRGMSVGASVSCIWPDGSRP